MTQPACALSCLAAVLACAGCAADAASPPRASSIVLDGGFDDWADVPVLLEDPVDAPATSPVELTTVQAADDPAWLYLSLGVGGPLNVQAMPGTLHLLVDADADPATGGTYLGMDGLDHVVELSRMARPQSGGHGAGFALRPVTGVGPGAGRNPYDIEVTGMPTWASDRFELRMRRAGAADGFARLGPEVRVKLVFVAGDDVGDETDPVAYRFATPAGADPFVPTLEPVRSRADGTFRVAQWNVSEGSFRNPAGHARILGALDPDVILLDEVYEEISDEALAAFFAHPALSAPEGWQWVISEGGGRQKTVVAARGRAIRQEPSMARVDYASGALDELQSRLPPEAHGMLGIEKRIGLSATGAWVDLDGIEVLFVPLDLQSAGWLDSPQDLLRDLQARTLRDRVLSVVDREGPRPPVVVGGDFNVVGSDRPLRILADGLDVDGGNLAVAEPHRLGEATLTTWHSAAQGLFGPGRLDLTLYADAALEATGGFVFDTDDLTDAQLGELGLERELSARASDHLVVVTDLRLR